MPILNAAALGHIDMVSLLLDYRADVDARDMVQVEYDDVHCECHCRSPGISTLSLFCFYSSLMTYFQHKVISELLSPSSIILFTITHLRCAVNSGGAQCTPLGRITRKRSAR